VKTFSPKAVLVPGKPRKARETGEKTAKKKPPKPHKVLMGPGGQEIKREWLLVDAKDKILGRVASQVANFLRGKHKPTYVPNVDVGDFVVVINADKVKLTGRKETEKLYYRHSGYPGGLRSDTYGAMKEKWPDLMFWVVVKRMLPRNKLRFKYLRKLKVYRGDKHPHAAQQPKPVEIRS